MTWFPPKRINNDVLWIVLGQFTAHFAVIAGVKVLTNLLEKAEYGNFALGTSVAGAVSVLIFGPLGQVVYRYYAICENSGSLQTYYFLLRRVHLILCGVFFSAAAIAAFFVSAESRHYLFGLFAGGVVGLCASIQTYFTARQMRKYAASIQALESVFKYLLPIAVVLLVSSSGSLALVGFIVAEIAVVIFAIRLLSKSGALERGAQDSRNLRSLQGKFLQFGLPFVGFSAVAMFYNYGDRWLLDYFGGAALVAVYAVLYQIAFAPSALVLGFVNQLYLPKIYVVLSSSELTHDALAKARSLERKAAGFLLFSCLISTGAAALFSESIVTVFASSGYTEYSNMLWMFVLAHHIIAYTQVASSIGFGLNRPDLYLSPKILQLSTMVLTSMVFVPLYGVRGMVVVFLLGATVNVLVTQHKNRRLVKARSRACALEDHSGAALPAKP